MSLYPITAKLTIITGAGRCGTKFFGQQLGRFVSNCHAEHEPETLYLGDLDDLHRQLARFGPNHFLMGKLLGTRGLRNHAINYYRGRITRSETIDRIRHDRRNVFKVDAELLVEANYAWWSLTGLLDALAGNYRVITIARDPVDWILSVRRRRELLDRWNWLARLRLNRLSDLHWDEDPIVRLAHAWNIVHGELLQAASNDARHRIFRMEDVFDPSGDAYRELLAFAVHDETASVDWPAAMAARTEVINPSKPGDTALEQSQLDQVADICGETAQRLGYPARRTAS
ncbi:MAG: hypothetical protein R3217_03210 [Gammaproteobacteria bacterium]|nr:hypothetical protein [Gammaproteobacteria bacterium]